MKLDDFLRDQTGDSNFVSIIIILIVIIIAIALFKSYIVKLFFGLASCFRVELWLYYYGSCVINDGLMHGHT